VKSDVAMTGEITLRGKVTAIGGLKEKLLAAMRGGIRTVIIPEENRKDLADIPKSVTEQMKIVPVRWIDEVLDLALERPLAPKSPAALPEPENARDPSTPADRTDARH
jgi:ATP-dependent Lon protease